MREKEKLEMYIGESYTNILYHKLNTKSLCWYIYFRFRFFVCNKKHFKKEKILERKKI